eukprot:CAMPEP_0114519386 /NCGR_PEP_ID=MMETSP0109-20121206/18975_1 /TAXON_ID=29199 /ORGANISM="Chlorarachnion reptans, Strain CCCM449" /LENGTH=375 /DNA_ID=CAMNT_0001700121 /DNA_START=234 /DNA_END=1361 /DNA_ORIENTATION=+
MNKCRIAAQKEILKPLFTSVDGIEEESIKSLPVLKKVIRILCSGPQPGSFLLVGSDASLKTTYLNLALKEVFKRKPIDVSCCRCCRRFFGHSCFCCNCSGNFYLQCRGGNEDPPGRGICHISWSTHDKDLHSIVTNSLGGNKQFIRASCFNFNKKVLRKYRKRKYDPPPPLTPTGGEEKKEKKEEKKKEDTGGEEKKSKKKEEEEKEDPNEQKDYGYPVLVFLYPKVEGKEGFENAWVDAIMDYVKTAKSHVIVECKEMPTRLKRFENKLLCLKLGVQQNWNTMLCGIMKNITGTPPKRTERAEDYKHGSGGKTSAGGVQTASGEREGGGEEEKKEEKKARNQDKERTQKEPKPKQSLTFFNFKKGALHASSMEL